MKIRIVGGDQRITACKLVLEKAGWEVEMGDMGQNLPFYKAETIHKSKGKTHMAGEGEGDVLLLPLPLSRDGIWVNGLENKLSLEDVLTIAPSYKYIVCGAPPSAFLEKARGFGAKVLDVLADEMFVLGNSQLTAEVAMGLLLLEMGESLYRLPCGVVGMGRIGRVICRYLVAFGADVSVFARKEADRLSALAMGARRVYDTTALAEDGLRGLSVLLNTVPVPLVTERAMSTLSDGALVMELASGSPLPHKEGAKYRYLSAMGLPGKYMPKGAGELLGARILSLLNAFETTQPSK